MNHARRTAMSVSIHPYPMRSILDLNPYLVYRGSL